MKAEDGISLLHFATKLAQVNAAFEVRKGIHL